MNLEKLKQTELVNGKGLYGTELSVNIQGQGFEVKLLASNAESLDRAQRVVSALLGTEEAPAEKAPTARRRTK